MKEILLKTVASIVPFDELEKEHQQHVLAWIKSDEPLFRIKKPDVPNKHLVSYFVVFDRSNFSLLLVDHINAELWLPTGGHVEIDEDPKSTVVREAKEELGINVQFLNHSNPVFVTVSETVGKTGGHTDVSLWYVVAGKTTDVYEWDKSEFNDCRWLSIHEILETDISVLDRNLHRFARKVQSFLI